MDKSKLIFALGKIPLLSNALRWYANCFTEGSIVAIKSGCVAGYKWKRYHRYVNGYWLGCYEIQMQKAISWHLDSGQVFYDIGANAGFFSLIAARTVGSHGHVFAFEPEPGNVECIAEQFRLNNLSQCTVIEKAVGAQTGTIGFQRGKDSSTGKVISKSNNQSVDTRVSLVSLDDFLEEGNPSPDLVKIDVEGAETDVLSGATGLLHSSKAPKLLIEVHRGCAEKLAPLLDAAGYTLFDLSLKKIEQLHDPYHFLAIRK